MTPTLNEIAYNILNLTHPKSTVSDSINIDVIKFNIKAIRAQLIKQDSNKGYTADSYIIQDLGCVSVIPVDRGECCSVDIGCEFMRTELPIPSTIELHDSELLTRVGPVDKIARPYDQVKYERVPFLGNNKFTKNLIKAFRIHKGGYIYLSTPKNHDSALLTKINIQGVFEDPELAADFSTCEGNVCYSDDTPFPVKAHMIPTITDMVIKKLGLVLNSNIDVDTDNKTNFKPTTIQ